jgi:hypothetical protein
MSIHDGDEMHCPTCGAEQAWADTCRRCKCDLRLLRAAEQAYQWHHLRCMRNLAAGSPERALRHARACHRLRPGAPSRRLIALSYLLSERWLEASEWAEIAGDQPERPGE